MDDLSGFCCQDKDCPDYGKRGLGNLTVCGRFGKGKQFRLLYCRTCKARFSERKGTPLFGAHLSQEKILALGSHISEGCGVRKTERLTGVNRTTVIRYCRLFGQHSKALHDELVAFSPWDARGSVRRKMVLRGQKAEALRPERSRLRPDGGQLGPRGPRS